MNVDELFNYCVDFFYSYPYVSVAILAALGTLAYFRTKQFFRLALIVLVAAGVFYALVLLGDVTSTGVAEKKKTIRTVE